MTDFVFAGLLITPFVKFAAIAMLVFVPLRALLARLRVWRWFWHPFLAEAALYVCILAAANVLL